MEDIEAASAASLYVGRVLDLPPLAAESVFDAYRLDRLGSPDQHSPQWDIRAGGYRLALQTDGVCHRSHSLAPYRQLFGRLRGARPATAMTIELEINPWSATQCEVGVRPVRWIPEASRKRFLDGTVLIAETLVADLEALSVRFLESALTGTEMLTPIHPVM